MANDFQIKQAQAIVRLMQLAEISMIDLHRDESGDQYNFYFEDNNHQGTVAEISNG